MKKYFSVVFSCVVLLSLCLYASAYTPDLADLTYKGDVVFSIEPEYSAGETVNVSITASNLEEVSLSDGYLIIELVEGGATHEYPSQGSDIDNIFYEKVLGNISIPPHSEKTVSFEYALPVDLRSGNHRLEVYYETGRTPVTGISSIFIAPQQRNFNTTGAGVFPQARILRTKTVFQNNTGPVGFVSAPGSSIKGDVYVKSDSADGLSGLSLEVTVCEWSDAFCDGGAVWNNTYRLSLRANGTAQIPVEFPAPDKPGVYSIRLELKDQNLRTLSLYRSRTVVTGGTARIRRLDVDKAYLKANEIGQLRVLISAAGDGSNVTNATLRVRVLNVSLKEIYSGNVTLPVMSMESNGLVDERFDYVALHDMSAWTVCASIESPSGAIYDDYCYKIDSPGSAQGVIDAAWVYADRSGLLNIRPCAYDLLGNPGKAQVSLVLMDAFGKVYQRQDSLALEPCASLDALVGSGNYSLVMSDLETNRQITRAIVVQRNESVCGDTICSPDESEICCRDCGCPAGYACTSNICMEETQTSGAETLPAEKGPVGDSLNYTLIAGVIFLFMGLALFVLRKKKEARK
jgi:hypothetical protein